MTATAEELRTSSREALERIYREAPLGPAPAGRFWGEALHRVTTPFARSATATAILVPFERVRFGIDFDAKRWFFVHPAARVGHFRMDPGRSRWRDAETLRLHYDVSRLPFRRVLYDEVKPLSETVCLGLGGINFAKGTGDLFFFVLEAARS